jgi:hypothetical protein
MLEYSTNLNLSALPELDQKKDPAAYAEFLRMHGALKTLQGALDFYTGALSTEVTYRNQTAPTSSIRVQSISRIYAEATEIITYGAIVNIYDAGGLKCRNANATAVGKLCRAYCNDSAGVGIGDFAELVLLGMLPIVGAIPGQDYYMSITSGIISATPPGVAGNVVQRIGFGLDANSIWFNPSLEWYVI